MERHLSHLLSDLFDSDNEDEVGQVETAISSTLAAAAQLVVTYPPSPPPELTLTLEQTHAQPQNLITVSVPTLSTPLVAAVEALAPSCGVKARHKEQSFTRMPKGGSVLIHEFDATENLKGVRSILAKRGSVLTVLKKAGVFVDTHPAVLTLEAAKPNNGNDAFAFVQVTIRGHCFPPFENASPKQAIVLTSESYLQLLRFFAKDWSRVCSKMKTELIAMRSASQGIKICQGLTFYGHGVSRFQHLLESFGDFSLVLIVSVDSTKKDKGTGEISVFLKYKKNPYAAMQHYSSSLGKIEIPVEALVYLSKTLDQVEIAVGENGDCEDSDDEEDQLGEGNWLWEKNCEEKSEVAKPANTCNRVVSQIKQPLTQAQLALNQAAAEITSFLAAPAPRPPSEFNRATGSQPPKLASLFSKHLESTSGRISKLSFSGANEKRISKKDPPGSTLSLEDLLSKGISTVVGKTSNESVSPFGAATTSGGSRKRPAAKGVCKTSKKQKN